MTLNTLLPHLRGLRLCSIAFAEESLSLTLRPKNKTARCPICSQRTRCVHSHYSRTLLDLPLSGSRVSLRLCIRRFRCRERMCARAVFCERLGNLAQPYARTTKQHVQALQALGLALGGNPAARLSAKLHLPTSASTLLRRAKASEEPAVEKVRVLGVDDWALCKGQRYGTLLCDLERGCPIDLLPDRSAQSLAQWLAGHPEIEIISRDRGGIYAEGARVGAPQAQQVADRFHLLKNLAEVLKKILDRHYADLKAVSEAAEVVALEATTDPERSQTPAEPVSPQPCRPPSAAQQRRQAFHEEVRQLASAGHSLRAIGRKLGVSRVTVKRYACAEGAPPMAQRARPLSGMVLAGFTRLIDTRLAEGVVSIQALFRELRQEGYGGGEGRLYAYVRKHSPQGVRTSRHVSPQPVRLSARSAVWLFVKEPCRLDAKDQQLRERLIAKSAEIADADRLVQRFAKMVRQRQSEGLDVWLEEAEQCGIAELASFSRSLRQDYEAVRAGLSLPWSNGPVEGHVNRLKLIKRSMYGRAGIPLLRKRILCGR